MEGVGYLEVWAVLNGCVEDVLWSDSDGVVVERVREYLEGSA